jgi:hypothetical protein
MEKVLNLIFKTMSFVVIAMGALGVVKLINGEDLFPNVAARDWKLITSVFFVFLGVFSWCLFDAQEHIIKLRTRLYNLTKQSH